MFSQTSEYALRAVAWMAGRPDSVHKTGEIAQGTGVPLSYLSKVLQTLARADLVRSVRGAAGGYELARSPEELTVLSVVQAVDPIRRIERCPLGVACHRDSLCKLHRALDEAMAHVEACLREATIASMLSDLPSESAIGLLPPPVDGGGGPSEEDR